MGATPRSKLVRRMGMPLLLLGVAVVLIFMLSWGREPRGDATLPLRFTAWCLRALQGDLGRSSASGQPVLHELLARLPATLALLLPGITLGAALAIIAGVTAAVRPDLVTVRSLYNLALLGRTIPALVLAGAVLLICVQLRAALLDGDDILALSVTARLLLATGCIALLLAAPSLLPMHQIIEAALATDYIAFAYLQGLPSHLIVRIALRNAAVPLAVLVGRKWLGLLGRLALVDYLFAWGGVGHYGVTAIIHGDIAAMQGYLLLLALAAATLLAIFRMPVVHGAQRPLAELAVSA
jgi:ABC-type dipeptide/oligopeptide/nickel transport system permease component